MNNYLNLNDTFDLNPNWAFGSPNISPILGVGRSDVRVTQRTDATSCSQISEMTMLHEESTWRIHRFSSTFSDVYQPKNLTIWERFGFVDRKFVASSFNLEASIIPDEEFRMSAEVSMSCDLTFADEHQVETQKAKAVELTTFMDLKGVQANLFKRGDIKPIMYLLSPEGNPLYIKGCKAEFWHPRGGAGDLDCTFQFQMPPYRELWKNSHLYFPDDTLRIKFGITFFRNRQGGQHQMDVNHISATDLSADMLKMLRNGEQTDFVIECKGRRFAVHELVLAGLKLIPTARSPVFSRMLSTPMMEKNLRSMTIADMKPDVLELMINYMYGSDLEIKDLRCETVCALAEAADKYELKSLTELCFNYLSTNICLKSAPIIAIVAYRHAPKCKGRDQIFQFCSKNFHALLKTPGFEEVVKHCADEWFD